MFFSITLIPWIFSSDFFRPLGITHKPPTTTGITSTFCIAHILDITINILLLSSLLLLKTLSPSQSKFYIHDLPNYTSIFLSQEECLKSRQKCVQSPILETTKYRTCNYSVALYAFLFTMTMVYTGTVLRNGLLVMLLTSESWGSHLIYFLINSIMYATCFVPSTCHFFFTMIGASPAALSRTSTTNKKSITFSYLQFLKSLVALGLPEELNLENLIIIRK